MLEREAHEHADEEPHSGGAERQLEDIGDDDGHCLRRGDDSAQLLLAAPYYVLILLLRLIMVVTASGLHAPATRGNRKVARWGLVVALVCASIIPTATASEVASTCSGDVATCWHGPRENHVPTKRLFRERRCGAIRVQL